MAESPAPAGKEWFEGDASESLSADVPPLKPAAQTAADPQNAVANVAAGMLGVWITEKVPFMGAAVAKVSNTLNISEQMKQLQYGPWGDFLMPAGGYSRPTPQELRGKVMTNLGSYGGNYLTLGSGLSVAGVFFHPMLLMLIGVLYYAHRRFQGDEPIVVMGRELGSTEKNAGMILLTVAMVLLTGALETIMWIFGFAAMIIAAHAATHVPAVQSGAEPQQLDNVV